MTFVDFLFQVVAVGFLYFNISGDPAALQDIAVPYAGDGRPLGNYVVLTYESVGNLFRLPDGTTGTAVDVVAFSRQSDRRPALAIDAGTSMQVYFEAYQALRTAGADASIPVMVKPQESAIE